MVLADTLKHVFTEFFKHTGEQITFVVCRLKFVVSRL